VADIEERPNTTRMTKQAANVLIVYWRTSFINR
jgi:predicted chitinase